MIIKIMTHFYEKNIVEIKDEYTTFLVNIMTPFLYEGLRSIYNYALDADNQFEEKSRNDPSIKSPGILKIFQTCLREIPSLNNHSIENETNRIKDKSKCSDWFDDLIRAVIKSNIVLLTFSTDKNQSELVNEKFHERIECKDFVHKCYIEAARAVYNNPELFWHKYPTIEIKRNQREICDLIKVAIKEAIRKMLPMKLILKEYLKNEYVKETYDVTKNMTDSQYMNVKAMVRRDLYGKGFIKPGESLLEDDYDGTNGPTGPENDPDINKYEDNDAIFEQINNHNHNHNNVQKPIINQYENLYKDINEIQNELHDIEKKMETSEPMEQLQPLQPLQQPIQQDKSPIKDINNEINNYLKNSDEQKQTHQTAIQEQKGGQMNEIDTDSNKVHSETDRSKYFARYNV